MPEYPMQDPHGAVHDVSYPMDNCPSIGSYRVVNGVRMVRIPSDLLVRAAEDIHFTSNQLPRNWKYGSDFDRQGKPRFSSKTALHEAMAKANDQGDQVEWD